MEDICPSRDMAQPHIYRSGECVMCQTYKPGYYCQCGHLGDRINSAHYDNFAAPGHGSCKKCSCVKFMWTNKKEGN